MSVFRFEGPENVKVVVITRFLLGHPSAGRIHAYLGTDITSELGGVSFDNFDYQC
jgi:hypothetical protein